MKLFIKKMYKMCLLITLLVAPALLISGCAVTRSLDNWADSFSRPPVHHAQSVHITDGRQVIVINTGRGTTKRGMTLIFTFRKAGKSRKEILHKVTLSPGESFLVWLKEGKYVCDVYYQFNPNKPITVKTIYVPDSGSPFPYYNDRYAAGVVF